MEINPVKYEVIEGDDEIGAIERSYDDLSQEIWVATTHGHAGEELEASFVERFEALVFLEEVYRVDVVVLES